MVSTDDYDYDDDNEEEGNVNDHDDDGIEYGRIDGSRCQYLSEALSCALLFSRSH